MKKALSIAILTLATSGLILTGAASAYASKDDHPDRNGCTKHQKWSGAGHHQGGFGKMKYVLHHLDLSSDQQSEIEDGRTVSKAKRRLIVACLSRLNPPQMIFDTSIASRTIGWLKTVDM